MHKKKRIFQTDPKDPTSIRISSLTEFRSSQNQFKAAAKADEPKTSEYAFFKKLKTDASYRFNSHPLHKAEIEPNKLKARDCPIERRSEIRNSSEDFRLPMKDVTHVNSRLFLAPVGVDLKGASTTFQDICGMGSSMEEGRTFRPRGTQSKHEDLFSTKRQKLHQWVADISFPGIEELCSKGSDFVSVLLSRLFPESNEENSFKTPKYQQVESGSKNKLLTSPYSRIHLKKLRHQVSRKSLEVECGSSLENGLSAGWLESLREKIHSNSDSSICYTHNTLLDYNLREPDCELGERNKISWIDSDSTYGFPLKNYGHLPSNHLRELNDFHHPDDSLFRRKQHPLLLGWDFENVRNERTSLTSQNTELIKYPISLTSWRGDYEESLDDEFLPFGASALCASSVIWKHTPSFYSLPPSCSTRYCEAEYRRHFLEDNKGIAADLNSYPLTISPFLHVPSHLSLIEDWNHDIKCKGSRTLPSSGNHHCFIGEVSSEQHFDPGVAVFLSSNLDYDLGRECSSLSESPNKLYSCIHPALQSHPKKGVFTHFLAKDEYEDCLDGLSPQRILDHFRQNVVNIHDWSSFNWPLSLATEKACPLLLDKSTWDEYGGEVYDNRSDVE